MSTTQSPAPGSTPAAKSKPSRPRRESRWSRMPVNVRWMLGTVIVLVVLAVGGYAARTWNLARNAKKYLAKADAAEKEENWAEMAENLTLFLVLNPKDADAHVRQAKAFDKVAATPGDKVYLLSLYDQAAILAPERTDLLDRRLELLVELGRFKETEALARKLIEMHEGGAKASWALALALARQLGPDNRVTAEEVVDACKAALEQNPGDIKLSSALALTYREHFGKPVKPEHAAAADAVIDQMVTLAPQNPDAMLARNEYNSIYRTEQAQEQLDDALKSLPQNFQLLVSAGSAALVKKDPQEAIGYFRQAIDASPTSSLGYVGLGLAYDEAGEKEKALVAWNEGLQKAENATIPLNRQIARAMLKWGRPEDAQKPLEILEGEISSSKVAGAASGPLANELRLLRCQWHLMRREFAQALNVLKSVNLNGAFNANMQADLEYNRGRCYLGLMQWDQAATAFDAAAKTDNAPLRDWLAAADAWEQAGQIDLAVLRYAKVNQDPNSPPQFKVNYARALMNQQVELPAAERNWGQLDQALAECRTALPDSVAVKVLASQIAKAKGDSAGALRILQDAAAAEPASGQTETAYGALRARLSAGRPSGQGDPGRREVPPDRRRHLASRTAASRLARAPRGILAGCEGVASAARKRLRSAMRSANWLKCWNVSFRCSSK